MSEYLNLVSLPWHALQRSLANAIGKDQGALAGSLPPGAPAAAGAAQSPVQSWLVRALLNSC